jgi:plastocyanin
MTNDTSRRGFLECMAWAGTGVLWTVFGGMPKAFALGSGDLPGSAAAATLSFVQISDSHIGFNKEANPDVAGTLREAVAKINELPSRPAFVVHTGDVTHLSKPEEFDTAQQVLKSVRLTRCTSCRANMTFSMATARPTSQSLPVAIGSEVTWVNDDEAPHLVVGPAGDFKSQPLDTGDRFSFRFDKPGTYKYFCSLHPHMIGTIIVGQGGEGTKDESLGPAK